MMRSAYSFGASLVSIAVLIPSLGVSTYPGHDVVAVEPKDSLSEAHARQTAVLRPAADRVRIDAEKLRNFSSRQEVGDIAHGSSYRYVRRVPYTLLSYRYDILRTEE